MGEERAKSDLKRIDRMKDEDIDYSDIPELDDAFFATARVVVPPGKSQPRRHPVRSLRESRESRARNRTTDVLGGGESTCDR